MLLSRWLMLCCCAGLALTDRVLINRRARQKLPDRQTGESSVKGEAGTGEITRREISLCPDSFRSDLPVQ